MDIFWRQLCENKRKILKPDCYANIVLQVYSTIEPLILNLDVAIIMKEGKEGRFAQTCPKCFIPFVVQNNRIFCLEQSSQTNIFIPKTKLFSWPPAQCTVGSCVVCSHVWLGGAWDIPDMWHFQCTAPHCPSVWEADFLNGVILAKVDLCAKDTKKCT